MESVDELCQDANKFNNHLRNVARQQQQKDAYIQRRVSYLFRSLVYTDIVLIVGFTKLFSFHGLPDIILQNSLTFPLMKTKFPWSNKYKMWHVLIASDLNLQPSFTLFSLKLTCFNKVLRCFKHIFEISVPANVSWRLQWY